MARPIFTILCSMTALMAPYRSVAETVNQFDAVCTEELPFESSKKPDIWRVRIDLRRRLWCMTSPGFDLMDLDKCNNIGHLYYDINTITLRDEVNLNADGSKEIDLVTLGRRDGRLIFQNGTIHRQDNDIKISAFTCKRAPFSGFPAPTF